MEIMFTCQKESVQFKGEIKKLLKRLLLRLWMRLQEQKWATKQFPLQNPVGIQQLVLWSF